MVAQRKMGRGIFAGPVRYMRDVRKGSRSVSARAGHTEMACRRRRKPVAVDDEEAPSVYPRRFRDDGKHSAAPDDPSGYEALEQAGSPEQQMGDNIARSPSSWIESQEEEKQKIQSAREKYLDDMQAKARENNEPIDDEEVLVDYAKKELLKTISNTDVLRKSWVLIDEDWLARLDALPGNIYRLAVMGDIIVDCKSATIKENLSAQAKMFGLLLIVSIQLIGPPMIFLSKMFGVGVLNDDANRWECCPWHPLYDPSSDVKCFYRGTLPKDVGYFDDWRHIMSTKTLGLLMLTAFILNGLFVLLDERNSWRRIYNTFLYLDKANTNFKFQGIQYMFVDAFMNCWVISWCCFDAYFVIGVSQNPSDVLMNALGILFLYNLDDIGGDLGFVNEDDWPGLRLAWIYEDMVQDEKSRQKYSKKLEDSGEFKEDSGALGCLALCMYDFAICLIAFNVLALPILGAFTPFIQIVNPG